MPVHVSWYNEERTIILYTYIEPLNVEDIMNSQDLALVLLTLADQPIHSIVDMTGLERIPEGIITALPRLSQHHAIHHPHNGSVVCVLNNYMLIQVAMIFQRIFNNVRLVRSMEQAEQLLQASLPVTPPI